MPIEQIMDGLEACEADGAEAQAMARLGFLEWVFATPGNTGATEARRALSEVEALDPHSEAALAFAGFLKQVTVGMPAGRRRRRSARMH